MKKLKILAKATFYIGLVFWKPKINSEQFLNKKVDDKKIEKILITSNQLGLLKDNTVANATSSNNSSSSSTPIKQGLVSSFTININRPKKVTTIETKTLKGLDLTPRSSTKTKMASSPGGENPFSPNYDNKKFSSKKPNDINDYHQNYYSKKKKQCKVKNQFRRDGKFGNFSYKLDSKGLPILKVKTQNGEIVFISYEQALSKYYHCKIYDAISPQPFDLAKVKKMLPRDRINYLKETIPKRKIIEFQIETAKSFNNGNFKSVPGHTSARRDRGTLFIDEHNNILHFVDFMTGRWRTSIKFKEHYLRKLAEDNFYLFKNAGLKK